MVKKPKGGKIDATLKEKVDAILQEVETAQAQKIKPKELLKSISSYVKKEPAIAIPLIEGLGRIPTSSTATILQKMMDSTKEKGVIKAIKRTQFKLRQKGVRWETKTAKEQSVLHLPKPGEPQGYLGGMDSTGSRIVMVARPRPLGGVRVYFSIINDLEGIQRFEINSLSKKGFQEFVKKSLSSDEFPVVEAPGGYCLHLMKEASEISNRLSISLPQGYKDAENEVQDIKWDGAIPLVYQFIKEEEVRDQVRLLKESGKLHSIAPFSLWFLNPEEVRKYAEAIKEAEETRIVLTPEQKDARLTSIYMEALQEIFPEGKRLIWKRRLEEMAYILLKLGKERDAKKTLSAAVDLKNPFTTIEPNPFMWNFLIKSIYSLMETYYKEKEKGKGTSLIVPP